MASISYHLSALQLESVDVCRMYVQNYDIIPVCHSHNTSRYYFPGRWKKDELCHIVNRSNTLLIQCFHDMKLENLIVGPHCVLITLKPEMLCVMQRRK